MKNILLVSHYADTPGVTNKLSSYLKRHNYSLSIILNPLNPKSSLKSVIKIDKKEVKYKIYWLFQYVFEGIIFLIKYKFNFRNQIKFDLAICFDPLSFFYAFLFGRYLKIEKIVYFNVDFSTRRFKNKIINYIYLSLNKFAFSECDYFFSLTRAFIEKIDPANKYVDKVFLLRHTIDIDGINKNISNVTKKPNSIIYAGSLSHAIGFVNLIKALELIKKEDIDFIFDIYGDGPQKENLLTLIKNSSINNLVNFKGVVKNEILLKQILPKYKIGVCPYFNRKNSYESDHMFTGTDLSTKMVEYIGCGLPIVTTRLYSAFDLIEEKKFGFLVSSSRDWYIAIKKLLTNKILYKKYSNNTLKFATNYGEEEVLTPIFDKILK